MDSTTISLKWDEVILKNKLHVQYVLLNGISFVFEVVLKTIILRN